jgi:hypothetical protein
LERKRRSVARGNKIGVSLTDLNLQCQEQWTTPQAWDADRGAESLATKAARGAGGENLLQQATWPSPQSRDWKDNGPTQGDRKLPNLGTLAFRQVEANPSMSAKHRGLLNPHWVMQLMGFPSNWLGDWPSVCGSANFARWVTLLSRKSAKRSGGRF